MGIRTERYNGVDTTGSDGNSNRVLTLSNLGLTSNDNFNVSVQGLDIELTTDYTVSHLSTLTTITFLNALFDDQYIIVTYAEEFFPVGTPRYCTSANVFSFLQLGTTAGYQGLTDFSASTTPTKNEVEEWIIESEDDINQQTLNSWKSQTITKEYHTIKPATRYYEGSKIFMQHRNITTLESGTDKLEVWTGTSDNDGWEDYLVTRTEGRNNDYWVNEIDGILWLKTYPRILRRTYDVRLTYRFSEPSVKADIKKACIRLTAITAIQSDDKSLLVPEGSQNIPLFEKTKIWLREANKIIQNNRELKNAIL